MNKMLAYLLITVSVASGIAGVYLLSQQKKIQAPKIIVEESQAEVPVVEAQIQKPPVALKDKSFEELTSEEKGKLFEDFVILKLDKNKYFTFLDRAKDYRENGVSPKSNGDPDLKFEFKLPSMDKGVRLTIECKYRYEFRSGKIEWCKSYQLERYKKFKTENPEHEIFVAIGIGGHPSDVDRLFIVPFYRLSKNFATESYIKEFEVEPKRNFFYDPAKKLFK